MHSLPSIDAQDNRWNKFKLRKIKKPHQIWAAISAPSTDLDAIIVDIGCTKSFRFK